MENDVENNFPEMNSSQNDKIVREKIKYKLLFQILRMK